MSMMKEFKEFAMKGNLIDMAVGVVMGIAFGKVVSAFINGMVMPAVGMLTGGVDFNDMKVILKEAAPEVKDGAGEVVVKAAEEVSIAYGTFITVAIEFMIVAFVVFMVIKTIDSMKKKEAAAPPAPSKQEVILSEIRDLLKK